ncbi:MAG: hypothetical protein WCS99_03515 [Limisphaerales bacterium]
MSETVWDNVTGAFVDAKESKQIGFTQNYSKMIPAAVGAGALGGVIGGAIVGVTAGPQLVETRIVIPFGKIFENTFQSGLKRAFPNSLVCTDGSVEANNGPSVTLRRTARVRVTEFQVWEKPLNHLNLKAAVVTELYQSDKIDHPDHVFETHHLATNKSIGSIMSTSGGFLKEMNKVSNEFAGELSEKILAALQARLGQ